MKSGLLLSLICGLLFAQMAIATVVPLPIEIEINETNEEIVSSDNYQLPRSWFLLKKHQGVGDLAIISDGSDSIVEPRAGGLARIITTPFDESWVAEGASIVAVSSLDAGVTTAVVTPDPKDNSLELNFEPPLASGACYSLNLVINNPDNTIDSVSTPLAPIKVLSGDVDSNGVVDNQDIRLIREHLDQFVDSATAKYDLTGNGKINFADRWFALFRVGDKVSACN